MFIPGEESGDSEVDKRKGDEEGSDFNGGRRGGKNVDGEAEAKGEERKGD